MADNGVQEASVASNAYLLVPITLFFGLLAAAVLRSPNLISSAGIGGALIVVTPLVLATYSIMATVIAGRVTVDLSIGPLMGFINVTMVQLFGLGVIETPVEFFAYAIAVGIVYQLIVGLIVVYVRVQPIIVALSGFLALSGINLVIMVRPEGTAPDWMAPWGQGTSIYSPVGIILVLATAAWLLFARTAFFGHLRLMGSDERAAYTSGVRINLVRLGAHVISGIYAGLAALTYTSLIGSGDPTQGTTYTLIAVTALVLGGASLSGGRGSVIGSLLGAVNIYLITYVLATLNFGKVQSFVTDLSYGAVLVISLLLTMILPFIRTTLRNVSPVLYFVVLSVIAVGIIIHAKYDYGRPPAPAVSAHAAGGKSSSTKVEAKTPAPVALATPEVGSVFIFEPPPGAAAQARATFAAPDLARPIAFAAVLILALLIILRVSVAQAASNNLSPLVYIVVTAVVLLGVYLVGNRSGMVDAPGAPAARSDR